MVKGVTKSGFAFQYEETRTDDMRFVEVLADIVSEKAAPFDKIHACSKLTEMLLGKEQKENLYAHIECSHDGRVPYAALEAELDEIMRAAGKDAEKNS